MWPLLSPLCQHEHSDSDSDSEKYDETQEKLKMIRVKYLRLAHRLGQTLDSFLVAQVLRKLDLAEQLHWGNEGRGGGVFSLDRGASAMAERLEASDQEEPLDFSCTIMVLGKTGVGKSATINSIFDEVKFETNAFQTGTKKVQDVVGTLQGIQVRIIDTPGLLPSCYDECHNEKILRSVKGFIKKRPPDVVWYVDRLDMESKAFSDMMLLRRISKILGPSIWCNTIVGLTHATSVLPEDLDGVGSGYDMFVTQRCHAVQQAIHRAAKNTQLMTPISLVENRVAQRVLPNGQVWTPNLLLLSFASKILAEAEALLKDSPRGKPFAARSTTPPLPFLLSTLLQPLPQLMLPVQEYAYHDQSSNSDDDKSGYDRSIEWLVQSSLEDDNFINVKGMYVFKNKSPLLIIGQVMKDNKDAQLQMEAVSAIQHGEGKTTSLDFGVRTVGKDLSCTLRSETRFDNFIRKNSATAGVSFTLLGDSSSAGVKAEEDLIVSNRFHVIMNHGAIMTCHGDVAYGGCLGAQLRGEDHHFGCSLSTLGLSAIDWHGDLAINCNVQSHIPIGQDTKLIDRANLNKRGSGQLSIRLTSHQDQHLQLTALAGLIIILRSVFHL